MHPRGFAIKAINNDKTHTQTDAFSESIQNEEQNAEKAHCWTMNEWDMLITRATLILITLNGNIDAFHLPILGLVWV